MSTGWIVLGVIVIIVLFAFGAYNRLVALSQRVSRDGLDEELLHEIAAILDEAAQRIERIKKSSGD